MNDPDHSIWTSLNEFFASLFKLWMIQIVHLIVEFERAWTILTVGFQRAWTILIVGFEQSWSLIVARSECDSMNFFLRAGYLKFLYFFIIKCLSEFDFFWILVILIILWRLLHQVFNLLNSPYLFRVFRRTIFAGIWTCDVWILSPMLYPLG